ncbi:MAG: DUF2167 domain-containing protein [Terricaulis sp.]
MRTTITQLITALLFALGFATSAYADGRGSAGRDIAAPPTHEAPVVHQAAPQGRTGQITMQNGQLTLNVPHGWKFYSSEEAYAFLQRTNSAAPSGSVLVLLARDGVNPRETNSWATVVSYDEIGYVQPESASGLTDANFEQSVRDARRTQSRPFEGFAVQPAFDAATPTVAWAERQAAPGTGGAADLRMEKRFMGRKGVATLTTIGTADQQDAMQKANDELTPALTFAQGYRQADFQPSTDQVSTYSVPGLVTGVPAPTTALQAVADNTASSQTSFGGLAGMFPWIAIGVVVLAGVGFLATRRKKPVDEA